MADQNITEEWRSVEGHPGYEVSSLGRVRSLNRIVDCGRAGMRPVKGRILKLSQTQGYWKVDLGKDNTRMVHILVCTAWRGPKPSPEHEVAHWDDNKKNNQWGNLRWATPGENKADYVRHGRQPKGIASHFAKISEDDVREIRRLYAERVPRKAIAAQFGISLIHVYQIATRQAWAHIP